MEATQGFVDADNDTKIQVEESADEDIIRFGRFSSSGGIHQYSDRLHCPCYHTIRDVSSAKIDRLGTGLHG